MSSKTPILKYFGHKGSRSTITTKTNVKLKVSSTSSEETNSLAILFGAWDLSTTRITRKLEEQKGMLDYLKEVIWSTKNMDQLIATLHAKNGLALLRISLMENLLFRMGGIIGTDGVAIHQEFFI